MGLREAAREVGLGSYPCGQLINPIQSHPGAKGSQEAGALPRASWGKSAAAAHWESDGRQSPLL